MTRAASERGRGQAGGELMSDPRSGDEGGGVGGHQPLAAPGGDAYRLVGPGRCCAPRRIMPLSPMTRGLDGGLDNVAGLALGLANIARNVTLLDRVPLNSIQMDEARVKTKVRCMVG